MSKIFRKLIERQAMVKLTRISPKAAWDYEMKATLSNAPRLKHDELVGICAAPDDILRGLISAKPDTMAAYEQHGDSEQNQGNQ